MSISIEDFKSRAIKEVDITGFEAEEPITVKLRSLSLLSLVSLGKIPNALMATALQLFEGKVTQEKAKEDDITKLSNLAKMVDIICEVAMEEPSFEEIGEYLTDSQKMEIFYYTQGGLKGLESFREQQKTLRSIGNGQAIQPVAE